MLIWRKIKCLFFVLILFFMSISSANAYNIKPDITSDIRQKSEPRSWNRKSCCYPATPYEAAKTVMEEKLFAAEHFLKLSDILNNFWKKHTHQK